MVAHLLKHPWLPTIATASADIEYLLEENPGLRERPDEIVQAVYYKAARIASVESRLPKTAFPAACPWTVDQTLDEDFLPE